MSVFTVLNLSMQYKVAVINFNFFLLCQSYFYIQLLKDVKNAKWHLLVCNQVQKAMTCL